MGLFRDALDQAGSVLREASAPFTKPLDPLTPSPLGSQQGPDPLGLSTPGGSAFFSPVSFGGNFAFEPPSFINPAKIGTGGLAIRAGASSTPAQGATTPRRQGVIEAAYAKAHGGGQTANSTGQGTSTGTSELSVDTSSPYYEQALSAAKAAGIDRPDIFARLVAAESSYKPDAHNASGASGLAGLMPGTAAELGVDPMNPEQALQGGARYLKSMLDRYGGDYEKALAAYNAGPGNVDTFGGVPPFQETQDYVRKILQRPTQQQQAQAQTPPQYPQTMPDGSVPPPPPGVKPLHGITTAQYGSEGLATGAADYICGPIAAQAFVRTQGRNPTLQESLDMARQLGVIDPKNGMHGIDSTVQLIRSLGGQATTGAVEKNRIINEVEHGRPVLLNTPGHYFVVEGYDRATGKFDLGNSATALRASGGNTMYDLNEIEGLGFGAPRGAIYAGY